MDMEKAQIACGQPMQISVEREIDNQLQQAQQRVRDLAKLKKLLADNPSMTECLNLLTRLGLRRY